MILIPIMMMILIIIVARTPSSVSNYYESSLGHFEFK